MNTITVTSFIRHALNSTTKNSADLINFSSTAIPKFSTSTASTTDYVPYKLRPETYIVPVVFAVIFFVGIIGNGLLIFVVLTHKSLRNNAPNLYILNLSIGDFALILISVPFTSTIYTFESWPHGEILCKSTEFFRTLSVAISVYTLTALSADRYHAIVDPLGRYVGGRKAIIRKTIFICGVIWAVAILLAGIDAYHSYILIVNPGGVEEEAALETKGPKNHWNILLNMTDLIQTAHVFGDTSFRENDHSSETKISSGKHYDVAATFLKFRDTYYSNLTDEQFQTLFDYMFNVVNKKRTIRLSQPDTGTTSPGKMTSSKGISNSNNSSFTNLDETTSTYSSLKVCFPFPERYGENYKKIHTLAKFLLFLLIPLGIITVYYVLMAKRLIRSTTDIPIDQTYGTRESDYNLDPSNNINNNICTTKGSSVIKSRFLADRYNSFKLSKSKSRLPILSQSISNASFSYSPDSTVNGKKDQNVSNGQVIENGCITFTNQPGQQVNEAALLTVPSSPGPNIFAASSPNDKNNIREFYEKCDPNGTSTIPLLTTHKKIHEEKNKKRYLGTKALSLRANSILSTKSSLHQIYRLGTFRVKYGKNKSWHNGRFAHSIPSPMNHGDVNHSINNDDRNSTVSRKSNTIHNYIYFRLRKGGPRNTGISLLTTTDDNNINNNQQQQRYSHNVRLNKQMESRKKIAKMVLIFIFLFMICWLPFHIFNLWFFFDPQALTRYNYFWHGLRILGFVLSYLNSCINPVALYFISNTFKKHFNYYLTLKFLPCCPYRHAKNKARGLPSSPGPTRASDMMASSFSTDCKKKSKNAKSLNRTLTYYEPKNIIGGHFDSTFRIITKKEIIKNEKAVIDGSDCGNRTADSITIYDPSPTPENSFHDLTNNNYNNNNDN